MDSPVLKLHLKFILGKIILYNIIWSSEIEVKKRSHKNL